MPIMIRRATIADIPALGKIINDCAEFGLMLHRSMEFLYEHARDFHVAIDDNKEVVGVCGLGIIWGNLAEVYALAVSPSQRGKGLGKQLVMAVIAEAESLGIAKLMSLTYEQTFFEKCGFTVLDRQQLPMKVWSECARCPKNQACDEIAMVRELNVPALDVPKPAAPPPGAIDVPVVLNVTKPSSTDQS